MHLQLKACLCVRLHEYNFSASDNDFKMKLFGDLFCVSFSVYLIFFFRSPLSCTADESKLNHLLLLDFGACVCFEMKTCNKKNFFVTVVFFFPLKILFSL